VRHLLVVPGWYPHAPCYPLEGAYIREQAEAIGALHSDWNITISVWDQGAGHVSFGHFKKSPACMLAPFAPAPVEKPLAPNVIEQRSATWSWNPGFLGGHRDAILRANRINFERASERWGRPDLIHAHISYPGGWVAMQLGREYSIPYVLTEHMGPFPLPYFGSRRKALASNQREPLNELLREPLANADATIAVSPTLAAEIEAYGLPRPRFIPNLVDERKYRATPPRTDETFTFLSMGTMIESKGFGDLLDAISMLLQRLAPRDRDRVRFRIAGDGPMENFYRQRAHDLGLGPWLTWMGLLSSDRAHEEFQSCDCYVLPSWRESFGIVLVESFACGRPVIATRCGGPEAIVNDTNGLLIGVRDVEALARSLETMLHRARTYDPQVLRADFMARYSRAAVVRELDSVYEEVLARRRNASGSGVS
jgi:glycosyltransferase involved in cell wall biosynthesis